MPMLARRKHRYQSPGVFAPAPGGAAWAPTDLTGLVAWYKADTGVTTSGGNVTAVADQSGNGYNLTPSGGSVPYNATGFNGNPSFDFSASNGFLASATDVVALGTGSASSCFIVGQLTNAGTAWGYAVSYTATGQPDPSSSAQSCVWVLRSGFTDSMSGLRNGSELSLTSISTSTNYRIGFIFDGANGTFYLNNVAGSSDASTGNFGSPGTIRIGSEGAFVFWGGPIAEIIITNTALSSGDRASLDAYLVAKYGL